MKEEYAGLLLGCIIMLGLQLVMYLILDLIYNGFFIIGLITGVPIYLILFGIGFLIQAIKFRYKIVRRD